MSTDSGNDTANRIARCHKDQIFGLIAKNLELEIEMSVNKLE